MITETEKNTIAYQYLTSQIMPANSIVALTELRIQLDDNKTNCLQHARNWQTKALILFLYDQVFGQLSEKDNLEEYEALCKEIEES